MTRAYGVFAEEAKALDPDYKPETVNTDGWAATQGAWKRLFPSIAIILCFLHAFLKIRDRATQALTEVLRPGEPESLAGLPGTEQAALPNVCAGCGNGPKRRFPDSPMKQHTLALCAKRALFSRYYDHQRAHRTSALVDRLIRFLDRACFNAQYFHGTLASAEQRVRALALLWNFCPSSP